MMEIHSIRKITLKTQIEMHSRHLTNSWEISHKLEAGARAAQKYSQAPRVIDCVTVSLQVGR